MSKSGHRNIIKTQLTGHNGSMGFIIDVREATVLVLALCQVHILPQKRLAMAELLTRINFKLLLGNFEMNYETGEVRFSISWRYDAAQPAINSALEHNIFTCAAILDHFLPAIMRVNYSNISPVAVLKEVEEATLFPPN